jgi:hypothetical protein
MEQTLGTCAGLEPNLFLVAVLDRRGRSMFGTTIYYLHRNVDDNLKCSFFM